MFKNIIQHIKISKVIKKVIKEENLLNNLSELFSKDGYRINFKQDWIGRIYAVINPMLVNPNARIFEYDVNGMNLNGFVQKWIMEHMIAADHFIKNHELFDILTFDIKKIDENYNFLFVLTPISWFDCVKSIKLLIFIIFILIFGLTTILILI